MEYNATLRKNFPMLFYMCIATFFFRPYTHITQTQKSKDIEKTIMEVPVVDFQQLVKNNEEELKKLREACERYGCFRIINHTVPETLMAEMKLLSKCLHELPEEIKKLNKSVFPETGYRPQSERSPLYEALGLYDLHKSPQVVHDFCTQLGVSPKQRETFEAYTEAIHELAASVLQKMAESLGVVGIDFKDWPFTFRSIKYSFDPEKIGSVGIPLHSDIGCLTLLQDDEEVGGLEMRDHYSGSFKEVPLQSGSFFCLIGDVGHVWSNGRFHNVKHRVICKAPASRYCIGVFMLSPRDGKVDAPMELVDPNHPRLYRPFDYEEMRVFRVSTGKRNGEFIQQFRNVQ